MNARLSDPKSDHIDLSEVETALLNHPAVEECVVLVRETDTSTRELVAYVVSAGSISMDQLDSHLRTRLPEDMLPSAYVPVFTLPLTPEGSVDQEALSRLEVIDAELLQRWEEHLRSLPDIDQVAVVVQEHSKSLPPLHLSDILPGWKRASTPDADSPAAEPGSQAAAPRVLRHQAPAISHGGPLAEEADAPATLIAALQRAALQSPEKGIVYIESDDSEVFQTYPDLLDEAQRVLAGLRGLGLKPQDKVIFQFERNRDFITAFWGCVLGGFVPVPLSIAPTYRELNAVVTKLHNAWLMLDQPVILTGKALAPEVVYLSDLLDLEGFRVETIDDLLKWVPDRDSYDSQPGDLALLLLTSGSTGFPKGVMQTHRSLVGRSAGTSALNNFHDQDVSLNWMPLDHVGGLVMFHIRDVYLCCQQIHAPIQPVLENPAKWLDWIQDYKCTITWAPNFAYTLVNDQADKISQSHWDLSSMRFILNGGEAIVAKTARKFLELLRPHGLSPAAMHPAWGMSETCSGVTYSDSFSLASTMDDDPFVEVGAPIPGFSTRIVGAQNQVVEEGAIGSLQVKGLPVTTGYYKNAELNEEVFTQDGWFATGDLGFLRDGQLTITGREKEVIIINGINYHSHEIEAVAEQIGDVKTSYTAACAVRDPGTDTDKLAIFFHPSSSEDARLVGLLNEIRGKVVERMGVNPAYLIPVEKEDIPKTSIGKIQRSQLSERFEAGEFVNILRRIDILSGNSNTIPDWFYRKVWHRKDPINMVQEPPSGPYLVFLDQLGLGDRLCDQLGRIDRVCVGVEAGPDFAKISPHRYRIDPGDANHYRWLLESLEEDGIRPNQLLHLWTYDEYVGEVPSLKALEQTLDLGVYSLLFLVQALARSRGTEDPVRLLIVSSHAQSTSTDDEIACERVPVLGLSKTIPQEMPWLRCRHVDLQVDKVKTNSIHVYAELRAPQGDREVAYRNGHRLVCRLEKFDPGQQAKEELPFKQGGMYLVSGGLGGIGVEIAKYLLNQYDARLLLIGRTPLPDRSEWKSKPEQADAVSERIRTCLALEQLGGEVCYEAVDICDGTQLRRAVDRAQSRWQRNLDGVIHLAGVYQERLLVEETRESFAETLRAKVLGTWSLHQLVKDRPQSLFISSSSANGFFGGAMAGAYAAANSYLDCFPHYQRSKHHLRRHAFSWSMWDEVGMSRGYHMKDLSRARGFQIIAAEQGLNSLLAGLCRDEAHLFVGLDANNRHIRRYAETSSTSAQKLAAYFTTKSTNGTVGVLQQLVLRDRFGVASTCDFLPVAEIPLTDKGEVDREQLATAGAGPSQAAPQTNLQYRVAGIWKEVLGVSSLGIYDNFVELGGDSLRATQVVSRLRDTFPVDLPLRTFLLECSTIAKTAEVVEELFIEKLEWLPESEVQLLAESLSASNR